MLAKKDIMRWLFVVLSCEAVVFPLTRKCYRVNQMQNVYNKIRPHSQSVSDSVTHPRSLMT